LLAAALNASVACAAASEISRRECMLNGRPLEGVRVVEVTLWGFVPSAAAILADWGATVLKIEHPEHGDPMRGLVTSGLMRGLAVRMRRRAGTTARRSGRAAGRPWARRATARPKWSASPDRNSVIR